MSVKRNIVYNTILNILNVLFPFITTPYVSRILGVHNIGVVNFVHTYTSYFSLFALLGIPIYGMREIAKYAHDSEKRSLIFSELFLLSCISTLIFSSIYIVTIFTIPVLYQNHIFLLITGISLFLTPISIDWFFSGREKFKLITIRSLLVKIISICGLFIFVKKRQDIIPYLLLSLTASLLNSGWNFGYLLKKEVTFQFKGLRPQRHLASILVLFVSNIAISVYTMLNTLMLGFLSDYTQVGYYTSSIKMSKLILPVVTSMSPVMIARINTIKGDGGNKKQIAALLNRSFMIIMILAVPAVIGLITITSRFVPFFFGTEFIPAISSMKLLALLIVIIGISNLFGIQVLVALGHEKKFFSAVLMGTVSSFILNVLLIRRHGSLGASIASVLSEIIVTIAAILFASKVISIHIDMKSIYQPIIAAIPIIPVSIWFDSVMRHTSGYLFATITTSSIIYVGFMLFVFKNELMNSIVHSLVGKIIKR
jgi:O-antigen/teichoic acid export membrane protein